MKEGEGDGFIAPHTVLTTSHEVPDACCLDTCLGKSSLQ